MLEAARVKVIVLGGGKASDELARLGVAPAKSLVPIQGLPMANYVLRSLRAAGVRYICYVGRMMAALDPLVDEVVADTGSIVGNIRAAAEKILAQKSEDTTTWLLIATSDIPMLSQEAVKDFLAHAPMADLVYPIVEKSVMDAAFPGGTRTYARLRDGKFTGGNIFLVNAQALPRMLPRLEAAIARRKNPLALAGLIGLGTAAQYFMGSLQVSQLEQTVSRILGAEARVYKSKFANLAFDVDKPEDLELARKHIVSNP